MMHVGTEFTAGHALSRQTKAAPCHVGVVLFEGFSLLDAGMVAEVFQLANEVCAARRGSHPGYRVRLLSVCGGSVTCSSSVQVWTEEFYAHAAGGFDALFIAGHEDDCGTARETWIREWLRPGSMISDVSRPLADRQMLTWAAGASSIDMVPRVARSSRGVTIFDLPAAKSDDRCETMKAALTLIEQDLGMNAVREIAERLMPGESARVLPSGDVGPTVAERIRRSANWLRENCARPISVADAAQEVSMSERNYLRRFKEEMDSTPSEYLLQARLDMTRRLLTSTELPVDKIARRSGMGNGDHLAKIFRKRWAISPTEYRARSRRELEDTERADLPMRGNLELTTLDCTT